MSTDRRRGGSLRLVIVLIVCVAMVYCGFQLNNFVRDRQAPKITQTTIKTVLKESSDLTTAKLRYTGLISYTNGGVPFLTKNHFNMVYTADIAAGTDLSKAKISVYNKKIDIKLAEPEIQYVRIDPKSLEFYDQSFVIFNMTKKEDLASAISAAEKDARENAGVGELKEESLQNARRLVLDLVERVNDDYKVSVE